MRLIECYIENFGTFREYSCKFERGLNCIYSENGTGKTTLTVFLASMIYGLPDTKKQSLDENERKKYTPWQGGRFGGSLTFSAKGKTYIVERTFGVKASDDRFTLRDKGSGAVSLDYSEKLGEELFGIDRDGFLRTVFLSEKNLSVKNENKSISAKLSDLVGVDGDVGGFDAAIELLEKRRKFYYKQSGNCEINNVKAKISEKKLELDRLKLISERAEEKEKRLAVLAEERNELTDKKRTLSDKLTESAKQRERAASEERYASMLAKVKADSARIAELEEFFGGSVPDPSKIDEARFALFEGERIKRELAAESGGYTVMHDRYSALDFDAISGAEAACAELNSIDTAIAAHDAGEGDGSSKIKGIFPLGVPDENDVNECTRAYGKDGLLLSSMLTIVGIFAILFGIVLGTLTQPLAYLISAAGAVFLITGAALAIKRRRRGKNAVKRLMERTGRTNEAPSREALYRIEVDLGICKEIERSRADKLAELSERREELAAYLTSFIDQYAVSKTGEPSADIDAIRKGYTEYYTAKKTRGVGIDTEGDRMRTADEMINRSKAFLSRYETKTDDPFSELASLAAEYGYTKVALDRGIRECDEYAQKYGTTGNYLPTVTADTSEDSRAIGECELRLSEIAREYGMLLGEYERDMRECEKIDGVTAELAELGDTLDKYNENLAVIKATASLLGEACENMTSRYIGTTRDSFIKYESLIGGEPGEYAVDTYFTVTKSDRGAQRGEECYSRGTRDLFALSLRLALIDTLFEGEEPFIILDDPFIAFDDDKCKRGKKLLAELSKQRQILYFTCSGSRAI